MLEDSRLPESILQKLTNHLDILTHIFRFIPDARDIARLSFVSKAFYQSARNDVLWKYLIERDLKQIIGQRSDFLVIQSETRIRPYERYKKIVLQYAYELHYELTFDIKPFIFKQRRILIQDEKNQITGILDQAKQPILLDDICPKHSLNYLQALQTLDQIMNKINIEILQEYQDIPVMFSEQNHTVMIPFSLTRIPHEGIVNPIDVTKFSFQKITSLTIFGCLIHYIHPSLFELTQLTTLRLSANCISSVPTEIKKLKNLTKLYLENNKFTEFPMSILGLSKLKILFIGNETHEDCKALKLKQNETYLKTGTDNENYRICINRISHIPPEICQLQQLMYLNMLRLDITNLPPEISSLKNLQILNLMYTPLKALPDSLLDKPCLIECSGSPIWKTLYHQCILNNPFVKSDDSFIEEVRQKMNFNDFHKKAWQIKPNGARLFIDQKNILSKISDKSYRIFAQLKKHFQ